MKTLFIFLLFTALMILLFDCKAKAQLNTAIGYGYDLNGRGIAKLSIGYTAFQFIELEGEIRPSISRNVHSHNYVGFRGGMHVINPDQDNVFLIIGAGYYYDMKSSDKKKLNKDYMGTFVKSGVYINDNGAFFIEALYINQSAQFSAGIHFRFTKQERLY